MPQLPRGQPLQVPRAGARSQGGAGPARPPGAGAAGWKALLTSRLGLPREIVFNLPRVVLLGGVHLTVENHRGIRAFKPDRVVIATPSGAVVVEGEELSIGAVREGEVRVSGTVRGLHWEP